MTMLQLSRDECAFLRSQLVILDQGRNHYPTYLPYAFVAMLSTVLNSEG